MNRLCKKMTAKFKHKITAGTTFCSLFWSPFQIALLHIFLQVLTPVLLYFLIIRYITVACYVALQSVLFHILTFNFHISVFMFFPLDLSSYYLSVCMYANSYFATTFNFDFSSISNKYMQLKTNWRFELSQKFKGGISTSSEREDLGWLQHLLNI